jgi:hypothetical protein
VKTDSRTETELVTRAGDDLDAFGELVERENLLSHPSRRAAEALAECGDPGLEALREALSAPRFDSSSSKAG